MTPEQKLAHSRAKEAAKRERMASDPAFAERERERIRARGARKYQAIKAQIEAARAAGILPPKYVRRVEGLLMECSKCRRMLPRGRFKKHGKGKVRPDCRDCHAPIERAGKHRRHARTQGRGTFTANRVRQLLNEQRGMCVLCGVSFEVTGYHVDHVIPIAKGGMNTDDNIQLLCPTCNFKKGDR